MKYNQGTFTTGRTRPVKKHDPVTSFSQRSQESVLPPAPAPAPAPGKLNMAEFSQVSSALSRLNMKPGRAAPPADDEGGDYAVPQDVINNGNHGSEYAQPLLQDQHHHERHTRPKPRSKNRERRERAKIGEFISFLSPI